MISDLDNNIELLNPQVYKNIGIIPIKTPINYKFDILTLKKGFELGLVKVKECEHSTVNTLIVENKSVTPLLLIDGEEIVGGDQNRIVNSTIIISPESEMKIPVNCTEHGRWAYKHEFRQSEYMATSNIRLNRSNARHENRNMQDAVWDTIEDLEADRLFSSPTQAMSESYDNLKIDLNEPLEIFKPVKGQTGILIIINGEIKGFELFLNSEIYNEYHEKIIKSYLIDAKIDESVFTINKDLAKSVIKTVINTNGRELKNIGLEKSFELKNDNGIGSLYTFKDEMIHLSYLIDNTEKYPEIEKKDILENINLKI